MQKLDFHSFFLDQGAKTNWHIIQSKLNEPDLEGNYEIWSNKRQILKYRFMKLIKGHLYKISYKGIRGINLENSIMEMITNLKAPQGIRLTLNLRVIEIYGNIGSWFQYLKRYCIQTTFSLCYSVQKRLGKGNFAKVYKVQSKSTSQVYAVKVFDKTTFANILIDKPALIKEIEILRQMDHKAVIQMYEVFENEQLIYIVQEYLEGGELYEYLKESKKFTEEKAAKLIYTLLDGIQYIHQLGILHRDLKPENLMLRKKQSLDEIVICDFGLADYFHPDGDYMFKRCGTPGYVAPELLQDLKYDYKVDIYSIGILLYILLVGKSPFQSNNKEDIVMLNYKGIIDYSSLNLSTQCIECLKRMLECNPLKRLSPIQTKADPWLKCNNRKTQIIITKRLIKPLDSKETTPTTQTSLGQLRRQNSSHFKSQNFDIASPRLTKHEFVSRTSKVKISLMKDDYTKLESVIKFLDNTQIKDTSEDIELFLNRTIFDIHQSIFVLW